MKLYKRFKTIDHGVPVPLKIPIKSCWKDLLILKTEIIVMVVIFLATIALSYFNWQAFHNYEPKEMTAKQIQEATKNCMSENKKAQFLYDETFKVYHVRCK